MKLIRMLLSRLVLLFVVAAACVGLRVIYGSFMRHTSPNPQRQAEERDSYPSAPDIGYFPDLVYRSALLAVFCLAGRVVFRLRLNPVPRGEEQPVLLDLRRREQPPKPSQHLF